MEGQLIILRTDLVVFIPAADISADAASAFAAQWRHATGDTIHLVVLRGPVRVIDFRESDPDLDALAERLASRQAVA